MVQHRKDRLRLFYVAIVTLFATASIPALAQTRLSLAEEYLYAIYPEVKGQGDGIEVRPLAPNNPPTILGTELDWFNLRLREQSKAEGPLGYLKEVDPSNPPAGPVLISASFRFASERDVLAEIAFSGKLANSDKLSHLRTLIENHPEWSKENVLRAMRGAGVRFGPESKDEFLRRLPLKSLEPLWGKATVLSAEFQVRKPNSNLVVVGWEVDLKVQRGDQPARRYLLICEPFGGKVVHLLGSTTERD